MTLFSSENTSLIESGDFSISYSSLFKVFDLGRNVFINSPSITFHMVLSSFFLTGLSSFVLIPWSINMITQSTHFTKGVFNDGLYTSSTVSIFFGDTWKTRKKLPYKFHLWFNVTHPLNLTYHFSSTRVPKQRSTIEHII